MVDAHANGVVMPTYVLGWNIILFVLSLWTALFYAVFTRDWIGTALWLTLGSACLVSRRLTPRREPDDL